VNPPPRDPHGLQNPAVRVSRSSAVRGAVLLAAALAALAVLTTAASVALYAYNAGRVAVPLHYLFGDAAAGLLYPLTGAFLVSRRPDNRVGWVFAATSVLAVDALANQYAVTAVLVHPGALPLGGLAAWIGAWGWTPALLVPVLLPLLFPDGSLPSPRWRPWARLVAGVLVVLVVAAMLTPAPIDATDAVLNPLGRHSPVWIGGLVAASAATTVFVLTPVSVAAMLLRLRRSTGAERDQLSWLSLGGVVEVVAAAGASALPPLGSEIAWTVGVAAIPAAVLAAVLRHRLLDIELVLNRAVVSVLLGAVVIGAYLAVVLGVGQAAGQRLGIVAVAALALLAAAARGRVQTWVDRALFGSRRDPYAVVSRVGRSTDLATGPREALTSLVEELRAALRLPYAAVLPADDDVPAVESGRPVAGTRDVPVLALGEQVGVLTVGSRHRGERFRPEEQQALAEVARRAGALVQAAGLITDLQRSRERIVTGREEERRRLRRDLHDGVGPQLAGMALLLDSLAGRVDGDAELARRVALLRGRMRDTVGEVRRIVDDLRPAALDQLGLVAALREQLAPVPAGAGDGPRVEIRPRELPAELPAAVEVAAYRVVSEAVTNALRHARCSVCTVDLGAADGGLLLEVRDDGAGIPPDAVPHVGLESMRERAVEVGGRLEIDTGAHGTTVRAWLPLEV
jgi:signal transduction histidine kinase